MAEIKTINTRIVLRNDSLSAWENSSKVLLKGEVALGRRDDGSYDLRVGDGEHAWSGLSESFKISSDQVIGLDDRIGELSATVDNGLSTLNTAINNGLSNLNDVFTKELAGLSIVVNDGLAALESDKLSKSEFAELSNSIGLSAASAEDKVATQSYVKDAVADLAGAMHFAGVVDSVPADSEDGKYKAGDVVIIKDTSKEYVFDGTIWHELGDEILYATKAELSTVNETLTAAIADEAAIRAAADADISAKVDNKIFAGEYGNVVSAESLSVVKISQADYHDLVSEGNVDDNAIYIVNSEGEYNMYGEKIVNVGTPTNATDAANKLYVDETVEAAKNAAIAAIPLSVSQLIWDIDEIYCGGAN